jgi:ABC-type amino acid transport substrate-binding protein
MITRRSTLTGFAGFALLSAGLNSPARAAQDGNRVLVSLQNNVFANLFDGHPEGVMLETVDTVLRRWGREPVHVVMQNGDTFVAVETPSNRTLALYTDPILTEYNVIALPAGKDMRLNHTSDLHGLRLGGRVGYQYPLLDPDPQIHMERYSQDGELIRNLILGRIDAAVISALSDVYKLRAEGVMPRIHLLDRAVGMVPLRAALSNRLFTASDLDRFNATLAGLRKGREWQQILERNGFADLAVDWPLIAS